MKILPIAFDSLGTRSMATFIKTKDVRILIDPGVSLAPIRYSLPPHPVELQKLKEHWSEVVKFAEKAEILIITHYHYDHHNPSDNLEIYERKIVLLKHPTEKINLSQKRRAAFFLDQIKGFPKRIEYCDGKEFTFGETRIKFSKPVFHGTNPRLGFVVEVLIDDGYKFLYTSDVEGPAIEEQIEFILKAKPNLIFLDGPMTYMLGFRYSYASLNNSIENMMKMIKNCPLDALVVDHHFLRDLRWRERIEDVFKAAEVGKVKLQCAAEYAGKPIDMLEARRRELWGED